MQGERAGNRCRVKQGQSEWIEDGLAFLTGRCDRARCWWVDSRRLRMDVLSWGRCMKYKEGELVRFGFLILLFGVMGLRFGCLMQLLVVCLFLLTSLLI